MSSPVPPPAPHLATPEPTDVTAESFEAWSRAIADGFHEQLDDEMLAADRRVLEDDRCFGYTVDGRWVASFGAITRRLQVPGGADVDTAAVTVVTVQPSYRRRGLLTAMMRRQLDDCVRRGEPIAALWASESVIYGRFGFGPAVTRHRVTGRSQRTAFVDTDLPGSVATVELDELEPIARRLHPRLRTPGTMGREGDAGWVIALFDSEQARDGATRLRGAVHYDEAGEPDGFATYRVKGSFAASEPDSEVRVQHVWGEGPAYAALWRYLLDLDLVRSFRAGNLAPDDPLPHLLVDQRSVERSVEDGLFVRLVDVPAALRAREYAAPADVVVGVEDALLPANVGSWRLRTDGGPGTVERVEAAPDLTLDVRELGTVYLGGPRLVELHRAGRVVEHTPGAVVTASAAFGWHRAPWCPDSF